MCTGISNYAVYTLQKVEDGYTNEKVFKNIPDAIAAYLGLSVLGNNEEVIKYTDLHDLHRKGKAAYDELLTFGELKIPGYDNLKICKRPASDIDYKPRKNDTVKWDRRKLSGCS